MLSPLVDLFFYRRHTPPYMMKEKWSNKSKGKLLFSHSQSNSCGVAICFIGNMSCEFSNKKIRWIRQNSHLRCETDNDFLLINLYNANKESEQRNAQSILCNLLDDITDLHRKNVILGGDFNIFFNLTYEAGNPKMKSKSVAKFINVKESLKLCDIW